MERLETRTLMTGSPLGVAANYAVVAQNGFNINGPGTINGSVASGNKTVLTAPAVITGKVDYIGSYSSNIKPGWGAYSNSASAMGQVWAAAQNASTFAFSLAPTQTFGTISNATTINGNGGLNVISLTGINLTNGSLTLHGSASDIFIVNVHGSITSSNSNIALSGGITANRVLINVSGSVTINGGGPNGFYGTILDPTGAVTVHDKMLYGELIGNTVTDTSGFSVCNEPFLPCGCMMTTTQSSPSSTTAGKDMAALNAYYATIGAKP
jgi:hypothetical protein